MKLKQQNMLYNFNSTIKSLETKIEIVEKLNNCLAKSTIKVAKISQKDYDIKNDIIKVKLKFKKNLINKKKLNFFQKFKDAINNYETEINILSERINSTQDLEFFVQNSFLTTKWKTEIDELANSSQQIYDELIKQKRDIRSKPEQERFEKSKFTEFKLKQESRLKESAIKLYQETIIVHFVDYYSRFEKWMR